MFEKSILEGQESELKFAQLAKKRGFLVKPATGIEQIDHVDFHLTSEEEDGTMTAMVDVKARKRINRKDDVFSDEWLWIEFKNVSGKLGWIHGLADFIAFEVMDSFILSYRKELCDWCLDHVNLKEIVTSAQEAEYVAYSRKGKQDLIARVLTEDVTRLPHSQVWKK
jgi:hypothetical protein|tara:strand:- start:1075 stop:1575 length:501 start_codon:yes stop_codon:yes gene_type:complete